MFIRRPLFNFMDQSHNLLHFELTKITSRFCYFTFVCPREAVNLTIIIRPPSSFVSHVLNFIDNLPRLLHWKPANQFHIFHFRSTYFLRENLLKSGKIWPNINRNEECKLEIYEYG